MPKKLRKQTKTVAVYVLTGFGIMLGFQNCSPVSFTVNGNVNSSGVAVAAAAVSGVYYNLTIAGDCADNSTIKAQINLAKDGTAMLIRENCGVLAAPTRVDVRFSPIASPVLFYGGRAFHSAASLDEAPAVPTTVSAIEMPSASQGVLCPSEDCWEINSNGYLSSSFYFISSGTYTFKILAKADQALGAGANMELRVDGAPVAAVIVNASSPTEYTLQANVASGTHGISIAYTNDVSSAGADRNLYVYSLAIGN